MTRFVSWIVVLLLISACAGSQNQIEDFVIVIGGDYDRYEIHVSDSQGRHTGTYAVNGVVSLIDTGIPLSSLRAGDGLWRLSLEWPDEYRLTLKGLDDAEWTLSLQDQSGANYVYRGGMLNASTTVILNLPATFRNAPLLEVDLDGDNLTDERQPATRR